MPLRLKKKKQDLRKMLKRRVIACLGDGHRMLKHSATVLPNSVIGRQKTSSR